MWSRLLLAGSLCSPSAACARYHPEPILPAATAAALEDRRLDDPDLLRLLLADPRAAAGSAGTISWNLETLTLAALFFHPDLPVARARLAAAQAEIIAARQRPNPTLSLGAEFDRAATAGALLPAAVPITVGPVVDILIETFGKRRLRTAQARQLATAAQQDLDMAAWQVRGRVRTALLELWAAQQRSILLGRQIGLHRQLADLLDQRLQAGFAPSLEASREHIALSQSRLARDAAQRACDDATARLAAAIGVPLRALAAVPLSTGLSDDPAPLPQDQVERTRRARALTSRADILASLAQYQAAQSGLQLAIAGQFPDVTLGPGYSYDAGLNRFGLSPGFALPIFNQNQGAIARAAAERQLAAARFIALQAQIIGAIDAASSDYAATTRSLSAADQLVAGEQAHERQIRASYTAGDSDRPTLVTAELESEIARSSRLDAMLQQRQAAGALEDALQQRLFEPNPGRARQTAPAR